MSQAYIERYKKEEKTKQKPARTLEAFDFFFFIKETQVKYIKLPKLA